MVDTEIHRTGHALESGIILHDDVQDGRCALGVVFGSGVGDDLDFLYRVGGDGLQNLAHRSPLERRVGVSILVDFER